MSDFVLAIKSQLPSGCIVETCEEGQCSVDLEGAPTPHVIVSCDTLSLRKGVKRCDFLFVADDGQAWVVPLELTSSARKGIGHAIDQLKTGAEITAGLVPEEACVKFVPVFVGKTRKRKKKCFRTTKIEFHGKSSYIRIMRCRDQLSVALRPE